MALEGAAFNYNHREDKDYYTQPGNLYRLVPADEKERIHSKRGSRHGRCSRFYKDQSHRPLYQADENCGKGIAAKAGIQLKDVLAEVEASERRVKGCIANKGEPAAKPPLFFYL